MQAAPGATLALFHTASSLPGVLLMWPLAGRLATFLEGRFRPAEDDLARARYLDRSLVAVPDLAVIALARELERMDALALDLLRGAMTGMTTHEAGRRADLVAPPKVTIGKFVTDLSRSSMHTAASPKLSRLLRYYAKVGQLANALAGTGTPLRSGGPGAALARHRGRARRHG